MFTLRTKDAIEFIVNAFGEAWTLISDNPDYVSNYIRYLENVNIIVIESNGNNELVPSKARALLTEGVIASDTTVDRLKAELTSRLGAILHVTDLKDCYTHDIRNIFQVVFEDEHPDRDLFLTECTEGSGLPKLVHYIKFRNQLLRRIMGTWVLLYPLSLTTVQHTPARINRAVNDIAKDSVIKLEIVTTSVKLLESGSMEVVPGKGIEFSYTLAEMKHTDAFYAARALFEKYLINLNKVRNKSIMLRYYIDNKLQSVSAYTVNPATGVYAFSGSVETKD